MPPLIAHSLPAGVGLVGYDEGLVKEAGILQQLKAGILGLGLAGAPAIAKADGVKWSHPLVKAMVNFQDYSPKVTFDIKDYQDLMRVLNERKLPIKDVKIPVFTKRF